MIKYWSRVITHGVTTLLAAAAVALHAEDYAITTFAGVGQVAGSADGTQGGSPNPTFNNPFGVAIDAAKNIYVADTINNTIRKITPARVVSTLAGSAGNFGSNDGTGSAARFNFPIGIAADAAGNVYVADSKNFTIRKVTPAGVVTTYAGAPFQLGSTNGPASSARFFLPYGVAVDSSGNVYVADGGNHLIRKIAADGTVSTLAGAAQQPGSTDGTGGAARFNSPWGLAVDGAGNVYVADSENNTIRKVTAAGVVTTIAGAAGATGSVDGPGATARFNRPRGISIDAGGNIYVADYSNATIRQINAAGIVTTLAGTPQQVGTVDSVGLAARFYDPVAVVADGTVIYVADSSNNLIRRGAPASSAALPTITVQPLEQEVAVGQSVTLRVGATGSGLTYQWLRNGEPIAGATSSTFTISSAQDVNYASYSVRVSVSGGGTIDSQPANIAVLPVGSGPIQITARPLTQQVDVGQSVTFSVAASGSSLRYQWLKNGTAISGATNATYTISSAQAGDAATYTVRITSGDATETATAKLFVGANAGPGFTISQQPAGRTVLAGEPVSFFVGISGSVSVSYRWFKNDAEIPGATAATFTIPSAQQSDVGLYRVRVTSAGGSVDSESATLAIGAPPPPPGPSARLSNLSVRTAMAAGQTLIVGVVVAEGSRDILVRAAGPALAGFGLSGAMADPRLELYNDSTLVLSNDDWPANLATTFTSVGAFAFAPGSKDAAFVQSIQGGRSIQARGTGAGVVLVEAYDLGTSNTPRLINVSARNRVGTGDDILIAGFNVTGTGEKQLLIRAVGPKLTAFGVTGVLADPKLEVYNSGGTKLTENDNWAASLASTFTAVGAFALDTGSRDAALLATLPPGAYTVQVRGADNGTGEALVEVYEVP